jgi:hypothetical protein
VTPTISLCLQHRMRQSCALAAQDEAELRSLGDQMKDLDISWCVTEEPDFDNEVTALAALPNGHSRKLFGSLPLAGR